jgi:NAD(P)H dehydrogenase (quinone)
VTGATGKIGSQLIPRLVEQPGVSVCAFARDATKVAPLYAAGAEVMLGSLEDSRALNLAAQGVDTLVLITPASPNAADQARAVLAAACEAGVRKVVRVSVFNAASDGPSEVTRQHGSTDAEIRCSGLTYTILRPPFFMQNLCFLAAESIAKEGKVYFGTGQGRLGMIDLRDVVDCADECLRSDAYDNKIFTLTGPESIGFHDIADRLSDLLGCPIQYVPVRSEAVEQFIRSIGQSAWYGRVMRDLCRAYSEGWGDVVTGDVAHITGHRPRSFEVFAREILLPTLALRPRQAHGLDRSPRPVRDKVFS